jgi:hypothetical protein
MAKDKVPLGVPEGDAWSVNPDGTSCVYGDGKSRNSLYNADFVHGGPDARGYDWQEQDSSGYGLSGPTPRRESRPFKIRVD